MAVSKQCLILLVMAITAIAQPSMAAPHSKAEQRYLDYLRQTQATLQAQAELLPKHQRPILREITRRLNKPESAVLKKFHSMRAVARGLNAKWDKRWQTKLMRIIDHGAYRFSGINHFPRSAFTIKQEQTTALRARSLIYWFKADLASSREVLQAAIATKKQPKDSTKVPPPKQRAKQPEKSNTADAKRLLANKKRLARDRKLMTPYGKKLDKAFALVKKKQYQAAIDIVQPLLAQWTKEGKLSYQKLVRWNVYLGDWYYNLEKPKNSWKKSADFYHAAASLHHKHKATNSLNYGRINTRLGHHYKYLFDHKTGLKHAHLALPIYQKSLGEGNADTLDLRILLGRLEQRADNFTAALSHYRRVIQPRNKSKLPKERWLLAARNMAHIYKWEGNYRRASYWYTKALAHANSEKYGGKNEKRAAKLRYWRGDVHLKARKLSAAIKDLQAVKHWLEKRKETKQFQYTDILLRLGDALTANKQYTEAYALYNQSLAIHRERERTDLISYAEVLSSQGWWLHQQGRYDYARVLYRQAIEAPKANIHPLSSFYTQLMTRWGRTLLAQGNHKLALETLETAYNHIKDDLKPYGPTKIRYQLDIARCYLAAGEHDKARTTFKLATDIDNKHTSSLRYVHGKLAATIRKQITFASLQQLIDKKDYVAALKAANFGKSVTKFGSQISCHICSATTLTKEEQTRLYLARGKIFHELKNLFASQANLTLAEAILAHAHDTMDANTHKALSDTLQKYRQAFLN